jgi:transcriptional regulator with XRE-family HTH domain
MARIHVAALETFTGHHDRGKRGPGEAEAADAITLGRRIRHFRGAAELTLAQLADVVGSTPGQLSLVENGRREPRLSTLKAVATALGVPLAELVAAEPPPGRRDALEIELDRAQRSPLFATLGLPAVTIAKKLPIDALEALVSLHRELARRENASSATPEEARRLNTELRLLMQAQHNHLPEIEDLAETMARDAGYTVGALTHRSVARMASLLGFNLIHVDDLPHSTRTVTDLENGRIYLPPASIPGGHGLRSLALQAIAHRILGHEQPDSYAEFLRQRLEINYFAAACLMPRRASVEFLSRAKAQKDLAVEDFRDAFGVTHEAAAHRLTNLAGRYLDLPVHFLRTGDDGALYRGYEDDGVLFPQDATGAIEGQPVCRSWSARTVFGQANRTTENYQHTDTPQGTYWCSSQSGKTPAGEFSITVGVPYAQAKWFRGRDTGVRRTSRCPDEGCCRRPDRTLAEHWRPHAWPSAHLHAHVLAPLPSGTFPGVDEGEVYAFLEQHARP